MLKKLIAIDNAYANMMARNADFDVFPVEEFRDLAIAGRHDSDSHGEGIGVQSDGIDVIETLITLVKRVPENDSIEEIARVAEQVDRIQYALEMKGCRVIVCPAKRNQGGYKQSDDSRLMIATLSICLKLRPDFLVFVAADGDYAPLLWELRNEGIRTEVVAVKTTLASDLQRAAYNVVDLQAVFETIKERR
jgi:predicted Zn-ribbon and HTH transcriptional regulator